MPSNFRSFLAFGPSLVLSGMLRRVPSRLSVTFFVMCITSRLWGMWRTFQYGRSQKTDLAFHTPRSDFVLGRFFPGAGHSSKLFRSSSISSPLLVRGDLSSSSLPLNRSPRFFHG